jgi:hypothetical protein
MVILEMGTWAINIGVEERLHPTPLCSISAIWVDIDDITFSLYENTQVTPSEILHCD